MTPHDAILTTPFELAMSFVAKWEGADSDHPSDRGGRTSRGITQRSYDAYRDRNGQPRQDVFIAKDAEVHAIYRREYWERPRIGELPFRLALVVFDSGVNCGPARAVEWCQDAIASDDVKVDGIIGPITLAGARASSEIRVALGVIARRSEFYQRLIQNDPSQQIFERGWRRRIANLAEEVLLK